MLDGVDGIALHQLGVQWLEVRRAASSRATDTRSASARAAGRSAAGRRAANALVLCGCCVAVGSATTPTDSRAGLSYVHLGPLRVLARFDKWRRLHNPLVPSLVCLLDREREPAAGALSTAAYFDDTSDSLAARPPS